MRLAFSSENAFEEQLFKRYIPYWYVFLYIFLYRQWIGEVKYDNVNDVSDLLLYLISIIFFYWGFTFGYFCSVYNCYETPDMMNRLLSKTKLSLISTESACSKLDKLYLFPIFGHAEDT